MRGAAASVRTRNVRADKRMNMECSEFDEISEAYLSDELLVETNIQVFQHLEGCRKCRESFTARRKLRQQMSSSVRYAKEFQLDPVFARRLTAELKEAALFESTRRRSLAPRILIPLFAGALIVGVLGLVVMNLSSTGRLSVVTSLSEQPVIEGIAGMFADAIGHHRSCAIQKLRIWEQLALAEPAGDSIYRETIVRPLQESVSARVKLLHVDDCIFEGNPFAHVILKDGEKVISVFVAKPASAPGDPGDAADTIMSKEESEFQVAAFRKDAQAVFVVSDLSEAENLSFARTLLNAWNRA